MDTPVLGAFAGGFAASLRPAAREWLAAVTRLHCRGTKRSPHLPEPSPAPRRRTADPPFHVLLLRHGQTDANATGVLQGWRPTPLNDLGRRQALMLARRVVAFEPRVQRLVSSDLARAVQTAGPVAAAAGLELVTSAEWRERGGGLLEGKAIGERETWRTTAGDVEAPGAEPVAAFRQRVRRVLQGLP